VKVVLQSYVSYAPYFIAIEEGFFDEQALGVELVSFKTGTEAVPALVRGELDVSAGGISSGLLNAMAKGENLRIVADKSHIDPDGCNYIAGVAGPDLAESLEAQGSSALIGRKVGSVPAGPQAYYTSRMLQQFGLSLDDVEMVNLRNPTKLAAIEEGTLDLAVTAEPWVTRISKVPGTRVMLPAQEVIPDYQVAILAYGPSILEKNPQVGKRFMTAYLKAVRQYNRGKTERNLEILLKYTKMDRELLLEACWPAFRSDGWISVQSVLDFQKWSVENGFLDPDSTVPEDKFWDPSFVDHANRVLGEPSG
jgi:NitT/TauT family transport system substrate-binding protein